MRRAQIDGSVIHYNKGVSYLLNIENTLLWRC